MVVFTFLHVSRNYRYEEVIYFDQKMLLFMTSNIYSEINETESQSYISISRHTLTADIADAAELRTKFVLFAKFGDKSADGATIKLTQGLSSD